MTGPRAAEPGYDNLMQARAGWMSLTGEPDGPPTRSGLSLVDLAGGYVSAIAVLAGVHRARRDGVGCDCDVSLFETALSELMYIGTWAASRGYLPPRRAWSAHPSIVPFQSFPTADGWIAVACAKQKFWVALCEAIGRPELADALPRLREPRRRPGRRRRRADRGLRRPDDRGARRRARRGGRPLCAGQRRRRRARRPAGGGAGRDRLVRAPDARRGAAGDDAAAGARRGRAAPPGAEARRAHRRGAARALRLRAGADRRAPRGRGARLRTTFLAVVLLAGQLPAACRRPAGGRCAYRPRDERIEARSRPEEGGRGSDRDDRVQAVHRRRVGRRRRQRDLRGPRPVHRRGGGDRSRGRPRGRAAGGRGRRGGLPDLVEDAACRTAADLPEGGGHPREPRRRGRLHAGPRDGRELRLRHVPARLRPRPLPPGRGLRLPADRPGHSVRHGPVRDGDPQARRRRRRDRPLERGPDPVRALDRGAARAREHGRG